MEKTMRPGVARSAHETARDDPGGSPSIRNGSSYVLVADDDPVVRDFLIRCLEKWGYRVRQAESAAEALELMADRPASVVLCDIRTPGQDGLWLAERLRTNWPNTAVVMATALDDLRTVTKSKELGVTDYVTKPIAPEQLGEAIRRAVSAAGQETPMSADSAEDRPELLAAQDSKIEAEYTLESPVRCPACGERIATLKAVRLIRAQVNFTSTLPRRGRVLACPLCLAVIPAELTNF
jgi:CheY-like chemotaxis protein